MAGAQDGARWGTRIKQPLIHIVARSYVVRGTHSVSHPPGAKTRDVLWGDVSSGGHPHRMLRCTQIKWRTCCPAPTHLNNRASTHRPHDVRLVRLVFVLSAG